MISPNRIVVTDPAPKICVYNLLPLDNKPGSSKPPKTTLLAIPLQPTWIWKHEETKIPHSLTCTLASYRNGSGEPTCCIIDYESVVHLLHFSINGDPVREHHTFPVRLTYLFWMGHLCAMYVTEDDEPRVVKMKR